MISLSLLDGSHRSGSQSSLWVSPCGQPMARQRKPVVSAPLCASPFFGNAGPQTTRGPQPFLFSRDGSLKVREFFLLVLPVCQQFTKVVFI